MSLLLTILLATATVSAINPSCPLILDGRIPSTTTLSTFDTPASPFSPSYIKGSTLKFSQLLNLPNLPPSRFDLPNGQPIEITINDASIFNPGSGAPQTGFRRAGLILNGNNGTDASTNGIKTFHWSVRQTAKKLNLSHEYLNVWHERNDYNGNQFNFQIGALIGRESGSEKGDWKINDRGEKIIWSGKAEVGVWQNFGVGLDYGKNTIQVYYSAADAPLQAVTGQLPNDNAGGGQLQVGLLKKPTGETKDVVHAGFQEKNFEESLVYGGIFVEDSANGCVSL